MRSTIGIMLVTLLSAGTLTVAKNSKLNQYPTMDDCNSDTNIISHASPPVGTCHGIDSGTQAVYLVVGDGAAGSKYWGCGTGDCKAPSWGPLATESCIAPTDMGSIDFGIGL